MQWRQRPSRQRILAQEKNEVSLRSGTPISAVLVYPNTYDVGISNLGFQTVFRLLNSLGYVRCERAFFDPKHPRESRSLDSDRPLAHFDVIAFSISFEMDYLNVVAALENSGISALSYKRPQHLVMAGGVCTFANPVPLSPFIDVFVIGEAEGPLEQMFAALTKTRGATKLDRLHALSSIDGVYVPAISNQQPAFPGVTRQHLPSLETEDTYSVISTPLAHFGSAFLIEIGRGCGRACSFCLAGSVYRPVRTRTLDQLMCLVRQKAPVGTKIGLVGAGLSDYPALTELCQLLVEEGYKLALSSLRADRVSSELIHALVKGGVRTLSIAPEAGTERLRNVLNKHISTQTILNAAATAFEGGIAKLRLYFMIGLPFETPEDIQAIVSLTRAIAAHTAPRARLALSVSVHPFVPKPATPFQWCAMPTEQELTQKGDLVDREIRRIPHIVLRRSSPRQAIVQGLISTGNERVGMAIYHHVVEQLPWKQACKQAGVDLTGIHREKSRDGEFPWDFIDHGLTKEMLWQQYQHAKTAANAGTQTSL